MFHVPESLSRAPNSRHIFILTDVPPLKINNKIQLKLNVNLTLNSNLNPKFGFSFM